MKRKIIIVTEGFPYWPKENFLAPEISCLHVDFDISLLPLLMPRDTNLQSLPNDVKVLNPVLRRNYLLRILQGLFNTSPILPFLKDFPNIFRDKKGSVKDNLLRWATTLIHCRSLLSCSDIKNLMFEPNTSIYFYWCNYPICFFRYFPNKIFARVHGGEFNTLKSDYIPMQKYKLSAASNTIYLPISLHAANLVSRQAPIKYEINRLGVYPNNLQNNLKKPVEIRIVSVAYLSSIKRIHLIVEALKLIKEVKVEWVHFGDGILFEEMKDRVRSLPVNIDSKLMGFVPNSDILKFYSENYVDLFINVSETEGVPVSIMEALSFGIPVFATAVGGTAEIVTNKNGRIVPSEFSVQELADFIIKIRKSSFEDNLRLNAFSMWSERSDADKNFEQLKEILK